MDIMLILGWIVGLVLGLLALYLVIRLGVLHALRDHDRPRRASLSEHHDAVEQPRTKAWWEQNEGR
ncbi:hypothetical protein [Agromyces larvae]|uniref:Uncharacterized protein n=1 Tax=Agromyces larvae TaxID=2929802 RepID=A0ABY4C1B7_9MICO|nr:hypothetical protein [Agromyces larvae]UOE43736.1 hypothetical protein MTO99_16430 [Agromyces larvae]